MKIKLLFDIPVGNEHGMFAGSIFDAEYEKTGGRGSSCFWVTSHASGERVKIWSHEAEIVENNEEAPDV